MKDYKLTVNCKYNLLLKINNNLTKKITKNTDYIISVADTDNCLMEITPIQDVQNNNLLSFSAELDFKKERLNLPANLFDITKYSDYNYKIEIRKMHLPLKSPLKIINQQNISINGETFLATAFFDGVSNIIIENSNTFYSQKISDKKIDHCNMLLFEPENVLILEARNNNNFFINILSFKNNTFKNIKTDTCNVFEYSKENKTISLLKEKQGILKHGLVKVFGLTTNAINLKEDYAVYLSKEEKVEIKNKKLIPIAFLECVEAKNFSLAKTFLTEDLKEKISDEHLQEFFGDFSKIEPISLTDNSCKVNLIYPENNINVAKNFCLTLKEEKIYNIS